MSPEQTEQSAFLVAFLADLIRNLHVCASLEYLYLDNFTKIRIDTFIASVTSERYSDSFILRNLSTLRLETFTPSDMAQDELHGVLKSITRLIATLWPSGTHAQRRKTLRLKFTYYRGTLIPVTDAGSGQTTLNPTENELERLLWALKDVSTEFEQVFATINGAGSTVEFLFKGSFNEDQQEVSDSEISEMRRAFIVSLRSRVARIFPELHRRGILSVKFESWSINFAAWVEDNKENFEGITYRTDSVFDQAMLSTASMLPIHLLANWSDFPAIQFFSSPTSHAHRVPYGNCNFLRPIGTTGIGNTHSSPVSAHATPRAWLRIDLQMALRTNIRIECML
ncbi:hypothetical protein C8T65DRAFT_728673 [Cerioporus squamosus]|nr:hypothetical protein C8T65DRAFT_728673 [Cerioporus squamosus]